MELHHAGRRGQERDVVGARLLVIETAFTVVQWALVAPLTALAFVGSQRDPFAARLDPSPQG